MPLMIYASVAAGPLKNEHGYRGERAENQPVKPHRSPQPRRLSILRNSQAATAKIAQMRGYENHHSPKTVQQPSSSTNTASV